MKKIIVCEDLFKTKDGQFIGNAECLHSFGVKIGSSKIEVIQDKRVSYYDEGSVEVEKLGKKIELEYKLIHEEAAKLDIEGKICEFGLNYCELMHGNCAMVSYGKSFSYNVGRILSGGNYYGAVGMKKK